MQQSKALKFAIVVGTTATALLVFSMAPSVAPEAHATPDKGKDCKVCHTGTPPSKDNAKKATGSEKGSDKGKDSKK